MAIVEGIGAAKAAFEVSKIVLDLIRRPKPDTSAIQDKLIELQGHILRAQSALGDAEEENRGLKRELQEKADQDKIQIELIYAENVYWRRNSEGKIDGPYCHMCWDDKRKLIRLMFMNKGNFNGYGPSHVYDCTFHKARFFIRAEIFNPNGPIIT